MKYFNYIMSSLVCLSALFSGCQTTSSSVSQSSDTGFYQKDLRIILDRPRVSVLGFGVLPLRDSYDLELRSRKTPELIRVSNCHRDSVFRDGDDKFSYKYIPNRLIENGSCILQITFLDSKGYHQFGAISFRDDESLSAELSCNGDRITYEGVSVCQAKAGTLQVIEFYEPVKVKGTSGCKLPTSVDDDRQIWEYSVKQGYCVFLFRSESGEFHKLTTFGYTNFVKS